MHKFEKLLEKKGKKLSDVEKRAKSEVLSSFQNEDSNAMGDRLSELKKSAGSLISPESLNKPNKAKELLGETMEGQDYESSDYEPDEHESKPMHEYTSDEIDEKIQMLMDLKNSRK